jgi:type II secretory ATPase GspE/PulE/Tfp pilus assembly ATPase PilB-like protein
VVNPRSTASGYYGRLALFELLPVDSALRQAINRDLSAAEIETLFLAYSSPATAKAA